MNAKQKKMADALAALSPEDRARLERLAKRANTTAEILWPEVWQYGFEETEASVQADLDADADIAAGRLVSNEEVMETAKRLIASHAERKRKAG